MSDENANQPDPPEWLEIIIPEKLKWIRPNFMGKIDGQLLAVWHPKGEEPEFSLPISEADAAWFRTLPPQRSPLRRAPGEQG